MTSLTTLSARTPAADLMPYIERDGGVIVTDFFGAESLATVNRELDDKVRTHHAGTDNGADHLRRFHGHQTKRFTRLFEMSPTFRRVLDDEMVKAFADRFLLQDGGPYWLNAAQAIVRGPGETLQAWHRDNGNWPAFNQLQPQLPQATVSLMFALTDFTEENGATRVFPGSHLPENYGQQYPLENAVTVEMPAGSVFMYLGGTLHAGGANTTNDQWRRGIFLGFCLGYLVPSEASPLQYPLDMVREWSPRAQQLLGFRGYEPGHIKGGRLWNIDYEDSARFLGLDD